MNAKTNERGRVDRNYSWARRYEFTTPAGASQRAVMRAAKAAAGMTGTDGATERDGGDGYIFRPRGVCVLMFVEFRETIDKAGE